MWRKQFNKFASCFHHPGHYTEVEDFISKEVVEKIIADIPRYHPNNLFSSTIEQIKQQLRDKYL